MDRLENPRIQPIFKLVDGSELPGQPIGAGDYDAWKERFEIGLSQGTLFDALEDTTLDLVPGAVMYIQWIPYN